MEIVYSIDENEPTLQMLIQENPTGGADIYVYYNVWLRSKEDPDHLIHKEKMKTKYEYLIEEQEIVEHTLKIGTWQRTSVEVTFEYDRIMEENGGLSDDDWYELENNNADTIWYFYYGMIFNSFSLPNFRCGVMPILEEIDDTRDVYYGYINTYDTRLTARVYSPKAKRDWNKQYSTLNNDEILFDESNLTCIFKYYFKNSNNEIIELSKIFIDFSLDKDKYGCLKAFIETNGVVSVVPLGLFDGDGNPVVCQDNDTFKEQIERLVINFLPIGLKFATTFYPFDQFGNLNTQLGWEQATSLYPFLDNSNIYELVHWDYVGAIPFTPFDLTLPSPALVIEITPDVRDENGNTLTEGLVKIAVLEPFQVLDENGQPTGKTIPDGTYILTNYVDNIDRYIEDGEELTIYFMSVPFKSEFYGGDVYLCIEYLMRIL